jgi:ABC-type transport system involved in multi-copper enzyme maturation permease subunit
MMTQIKHGIAFLFGGFYATAICLLVVYFGKPDYLWVTMAAFAVILFISVLVVAAVLTFFIKYWKRH